MSHQLADRNRLRGLVREELAAARPDADIESVNFLASGEYTVNFRVRLGDRDAVLRIVTGSQMGLSVPEQALYEAHALDLLAGSKMVPGLIDAVDSPVILAFPYLLIEFLPGRPLNYATDLDAAAACVAAIHRLAPPAGHRLQLHLDPVRSILDESTQFLTGLDGEDWRGVHAFDERVSSIPGSAYDAVRTDRVIINSDLNPHNFIVDEGRVWLVDWEKARIAPSLMDVAHFLLPTTTLWRDSTAARLTGQQRDAFVDAYLRERPELDADGYRAALRPALQLAALRAISWCAWAVGASERGDRVLENDETLEKCRLFTSPGFLAGLEEELWN
ncbi:MAG: phosphotransferase [Thermomicrobiales bacterium]